MNKAFAIFMIVAMIVLSSSANLSKKSRMAASKQNRAECLQRCTIGLNSCSGNCSSGSCEASCEESYGQSCRDKCPAAWAI